MVRKSGNTAGSRQLLRCFRQRKEILRAQFAHGTGFLQSSHSSQPVTVKVFSQAGVRRMLYCHYSSLLLFSSLILNKRGGKSGTVRTLFVQQNIPQRLTSVRTLGEARTSWHLGTSCRRQRQLTTLGHQCVRSSQWMH